MRWGTKMFEIRKRDSVYKVTIKETAKSEYDLSYVQETYSGDEIDQDTFFFTDLSLMATMVCNSLVKVSTSDLRKEIEKCY